MISTGRAGLVAGNELAIHVQVQARAPAERWSEEEPLVCCHGHRGLGKAGTFSGTKYADSEELGSTEQRSKL